MKSKIPVSKLLSTEGVRPEGDMVYVNARVAPIETEGVLYEPEAGQYTRIPEPWRAQMPEAVQNLAMNTSGGALRFATDARKLCLRVRLAGLDHFDHMADTGIRGCDICRRTRGRWVYAGTARPGDGEQYTHAWETGGPGEWLIHLPLYCAVASVEIGLPAGAALWAPSPRRVALPMVFYGSSITQGGCASRPGNQYTAHLSRWLDTPQINLGFSGSAHGEQEVARYIATLPMSVFVLDYDHNDTPEFLRQRHWPFFETVRQAQPALPIVLVGRCDTEAFPQDTPVAREIILDTYRRALDRGDRHVYFVDGHILFGTRDRDACTVDGVHPNDLGFYRMARGLLPVLKKILG